MLRTQSVFLVSLILSGLALTVKPATATDTFAFDATLRIDYHHTGAAGEEIVALDRLYREGPWAGPQRSLAGGPDLGRYRAQLLDGLTGEILFTRGFDSYFGEWKSTGPAADGVRRTYHESVRTPFPTSEVTFTLEARNDQGGFHEMYRVVIDPADVEIRHDPQDDDIVVIEAHMGGTPAECVDVVILGEGYTAADRDKFTRDVKHFSAALLGQEPFASLTNRMSVRGVLKPSQERGCDEPTRGLHRNTALGCTFNSLGSSRYMLTEDNRAIRDVAAAAPYDVLSIMVNSERYGGGGIYNLFNTFTSDNQWSDYIFVHEFGHGFAGLADEYYSSTTAYTDFYPPGIEPVERNITRLIGGQAKWHELIAVDTPIPTPWDQTTFDAMDAQYQTLRGVNTQLIAELMTGGGSTADIAAAKAEGEKLSWDHQLKLDAWFADNPAFGTVGVFEGAGYCPQGVYRSELDCIMFSKGLKRFCAACALGIKDVVDAITD